MKKPLVFRVSTTANFGDCQRCHHIPVVNFTGTIDWGDGLKSQHFNDSDIKHLFPAVGVFDISMYGKADFFYKVRPNEVYALLDVLQWGEFDVLYWGESPTHPNRSGFLQGRLDFKISAGDTPKFKTGLSAVAMFKDCSTFNEFLGHWDTSKLYSLKSFFEGCRIYNQSISWLKTDSATNLDRMFYNATVFNQRVSHLNFSNVVSATEFLAGAVCFNQPLSGMDLKNLLFAKNFLTNARSFNGELNLNLSGVSDVSGMFKGCFNFTNSLDGVVFKSDVIYNDMLAGCPYDHPLNTIRIPNVDSETLFGVFR